jgi:autotransporter adhesin
MKRARRNKRNKQLFELNMILETSFAGAAPTGRMPFALSVVLAVSTAALDAQVAVAAGGIVQLCNGASGVQVSAPDVATNSVKCAEPKADGTGGSALAVIGVMREEVNERGSKVYYPGTAFAAYADGKLEGLAQKNVYLESKNKDGGVYLISAGKTYMQGNGVVVNGQKISGVGAGLISSTSTESINGSQLYKTNQDVTAAANAAKTATDTAKVADQKAIDAKTEAGKAVTASSEAKADAGKALVASGEAKAQAATAQADASKALTDAGSALSAAAEAKDDAGKAVATANDAKAESSYSLAQAISAGTVANEAKLEVQKNTDAVLALSEQVEKGERGLIKLDEDAKVISLAKGQKAEEINVSSAEGNRRISGVGEGHLEAGSSDAVTGGQLFAVKSKVERMETERLSSAVDSAADGSEAASVKSGSRGLAVGAGATSQGQSAVAIGSYSQAANKNSVAIGGNAVAAAEGSVAIGGNTVANRANSVSVGTQGEERQIVNVAAGSHDTDAVNLAQARALSRQSSADAVSESKAYTDSKIDDVRHDAFAGIAGAMAISSLPQATSEGGGVVSLAAATFEGESATAVGVSGMSANGKWVYRAAGSLTTRGHLGVGVGVGYQW